MKYTEEEKQAIKECESLIKKEYYGDMYFCERRSIQIVLNLLEKQQKEIDRLELEIKDLKSKTQIISPLYVKENYVLKGVIREKIEEYAGLKEIDIKAYDEQVRPLKELLGE